MRLLIASLAALAAVAFAAPSYAQTSDDSSPAPAPVPTAKPKPGTAAYCQSLKTSSSRSTCLKKVSASAKTTTKASATTTAKKTKKTKRSKKADRPSNQPDARQDLRSASGPSPTSKHPLHPRKAKQKHKRFAPSAATPRMLLSELLRLRNQKGSPTGSK